MTADKEKLNLMQADQARKEAARAKTKRPFPKGLFIFPLILFVFALISFGFYLYLDRKIEADRQKEFEDAKKKIQDTPSPVPTVVEGKKVYFIWECELYEYDIEILQNKLISSEVEGYKDVNCFDNKLFSSDYSVVVSRGENGLIDGVYAFDFTSTNILTKLEISPGAGENAFDFDPSLETVYQFIQNDAVYAINSETKEVDKILELAGFIPAREGNYTDEIAVRLSPNGSNLIVEDSLTVLDDPDTETIEGEAGEHKDIVITNLSGSVMDAFNGTFAHWLDGSRIVYFAFADEQQNVKIRNEENKSSTIIMKDVANIVSIYADGKESLVVVSALKDNSDGFPELITYLYDNSTGAVTQLEKSYIDPIFIPGGLIVGYTTEICSKSPEECEYKSGSLIDDSIGISGIGIYDIDKGEDKLIIGK